MSPNLRSRSQQEIESTSTSPPTSRSSPLTLLVRQRTEISLVGADALKFLCPCENLWFPESICSFSGQPTGFCDLKPLNEGGLSLYRANRALPGLPPPQRPKSVTTSHVAVYSTRFQPQQRLYKVLWRRSEGSVGA